MTVAIDVISRYLSRVASFGDDLRVVRIRYYYAIALVFNARYREAATIQRETMAIADRLGDSNSKSYAFASELFVSTIVMPKPVDEAEIFNREANILASETSDADIQIWLKTLVCWEDLHRGLFYKVRASVGEIMSLGRLLNDPRATGIGLAILTWMALMSDSYAEALDYSEQALAVAKTPFDRYMALNGKGCALVLLRRTEEGVKFLEDERCRCASDGDLYTLSGNDGVMGVSRVLEGDIRGGIRFLEEAISRRESEGYRVAADWYRLFLSEVYLQIIAGSEKLPFWALLRNLPTLLSVMATASSRINALMDCVLRNPQFHPEGHFFGRAQMTLGLLCKAKKKHALAVNHLTEAKRIFSQFGQTPILARVETALAELGQ